MRRFGSSAPNDLPICIDAVARAILDHPFIDLYCLNMRFASVSPWIRKVCRRNIEVTYQLSLTSIPVFQLTPEASDEILDLCNRAYEEDLGHLMATFHGATHVLGRIGERAVTHALWVTRWLQVSDGPFLKTAYVEMVATDKEFRRRGYAKAVMERVVHDVRDYDIAGLSPSSVGYYERLGWEAWIGPLFIRKDDAIEQTPDDEEVMIYRLPKTPELDLSAPLSAEWREGELW